MNFERLAPVDNNDDYDDKANQPSTAKIIRAGAGEQQVELSTGFNNPTGGNALFGKDNRPATGSQAGSRPGSGTGRRNISASTQARLVADSAAERAFGGTQDHSTSRMKSSKTAAGRRKDNFNRQLTMKKNVFDIESESEDEDDEEVETRIKQQEKDKQVAMKNMQDTNEAERLWEAIIKDFGEVELENFFQNCASQCLEHMVLRVVDEAVSGRYNWSKLSLEGGSGGNSGSGGSGGGGGGSSGGGK